MAQCLNISDDMYDTDALEEDLVDQIKDVPQNLSENYETIRFQINIFKISKLNSLMDI